MKNKTISRRQFGLCAISLAGSLPLARAAFAADRLPIIFLIGDSTVKNGTKGQQGWGDFLAAHFDSARITVENKARGGRSSRTYLEEGLWASVRDALKPGDFVLMQFGHNDGGPLGRTPYRATLHGAGEETGEFDDPQTKQKHLVHTYGWYLAQFVTEAKAKGATPIVLSPIPRNIWPTPTTVGRSDKDYGLWAKQIAEREKVSFVDLNGVIAKHYEAEGKGKVETVYFGATDHTHTTPTGAKLNAACVVEGIRDSVKEQPALAPLAMYLRKEPLEATAK